MPNESPEGSQGHDVDEVDEESRLTGSSSGRNERTSGYKKDQSTRRLFIKLGLSFFLFGLINNVLYVIILSAALDLVPPSTPKGIIAFCNIAPALVAKVGWPYILKGRIRYAGRLLGCCLLSSFGMIVVAGFDTLEMRLLGISIASFSSGLGELTFLQLSTTYHPLSVAGHSIGYFASGTGGAGLVGAFAWWELRHLGVRAGVGISSILPFIIPATYFFVLPRSDRFAGLTCVEYYSEADEVTHYTPLTPSAETISFSEALANDIDEDTSRPSAKLPGVALSAEDKWRLVKPLLVKYMLPLFCVYTLEYTINQGIAPTLIYPVPNRADHPFLRLIIHSIRDYYPLWQLVYQSTVFLSRSSISLGLPPLPARLLPLPAMVQFVILMILAIESAVGVVPDGSEGLAIGLVFILISIEGICGGLAYVNVFHRVGQERALSEPLDDDDDPAEHAYAKERGKQEREFKIGSIGFADSSGILLASILAVPTEITLCRAQIRRGKMICAQL